MTDVVSIQFRGRGKTYYFDPNGLEPADEQPVIVETAKGTEYGICVRGVHPVADEAVVQPLRPVVRIATDADKALFEANLEKEKKAFDICTERIAAHGLDMKLVDVEYGFDGSKILFFFTSDGRVDFRALVKDLAAIFRTRIELRQIGVRDGAKMLGGLGICGRPFCCSTFLDDFHPVSIKMAKSQSLSLNPAKISGTCGRLMCCLKYEQEAYEDLIRNMPKQDSPVDTPKGKGTVAEVNLLRRTVKVRLAEGPDTTTLQSYSVDRLGYTVNGEYREPIPEEPKPAEEETELKLLGWLEEGKPISLAIPEEEKNRRSGRNRNRNRKKGPRPEEAREGGQKQPRAEGDGRPPQQAQAGRQQPKQKKPQGQKPQGQKTQKPQPEGKKAAQETRQPGGNPAGQGNKKSGHRHFYRNRKPKPQENQQ